MEPPSVMSDAVLCSDLWPWAWIKPQKVARQDITASLEALQEKSSPKRADLRPVDIPVDIYLIILEQSSRDTLRNLCLVSKLSYRYAAPLLWKNVNLVLEERDAPRFTNALKNIIKRHGVHVETIDLTLLWEERYDEPSWARPLEAATNTLVELALEKMPKLQAFIWGSNQTPSNEIIDVLKSRPCLTELLLDSDSWNTSLVAELNFSGFQHLTRLEMENICDESQVVAVRGILDSSPALRKLRFGFAEYFWEMWELDSGIDVFDILFSVPCGANRQKIPGKELMDITIINGLFDEDDFKPSFFRAAESCFRNLDSLTLHRFNTQTHSELGLPGALRLRKLRLNCSSWIPFRGLLQASTKLELLHIQITTVGFKYDELIPLVCQNGDTLKELRLEWDGVKKWDGEHEDMQKLTAEMLGTKCGNIRELSLRADFEMDTWDYIESGFPFWFPYLTHFKLQRVTPKPPPAPPVSIPYTKPPKDSPTAVKRILSIDFLTGMSNGIKYPDTTAGDFFAAFIMSAAKNEGKDKITKLKYVGIDGLVYELHTWNGVFTFSEVPKEKVGTIGGLWGERNKNSPQCFFRLRKEE